MNKRSDDIIYWTKQVIQFDSQQALKYIYTTLFQGLLRYLRLYVSKPEDAEEIISDMFLSFWNNRKRLSGVISIEAYLYRMARNKAIDYVRKYKTGIEVSHIDEMTTFFYATDHNPEVELISKEEISKINKAIESLPEKYKTVLLLAREERLKYKEIAEILDISVKTVESHLTFAIKKMREALTSL